MYIVPISPINNLDELSKINEKSNDNVEGISFSNIFKSALNDYKTSEIQVEQDVKELATGKSDNLHNIMINAEKSELSLELCIQIRNKMLDAYNEIMRMGI